MIEVVSEARCTKCDLCIRVCPTNVFDRGDDGFPVLTRQDDCQTCFMCEAWCPQDAIFVAHAVTPLPADSELRDPGHLEAHDMFGAYRRALGWSVRDRLDARTDTTTTAVPTPDPSVPTDGAATGALR